jgi:enterobacterial common antigen flippase
MAVLLGPAGFGLLALYKSIAELAQNVASVGINISGVRQIASAGSSKDTQRIAQTAYVLRRTAMVLGVLGATLLIVLAGPVSALTFGYRQHAAAVALLAIAVLFRCVSAGQIALIQGMGNIPDLARVRVWSAFISTVISIPIIYILRQDGLVPSLIAVAAATAATSWWYSPKVNTRCISKLSALQLKGEIVTLLKLGFTFMATSFMISGATYGIRVLVLRDLGLEASGLYQAAWTLSGLYVGFILDAMGADLYPRLAAVFDDNIACNRLVNEQAQVSLLMAVCGVIPTLTFSPVVIGIFYSPEFYGAVEILRWLCLGMMLRILSWPLGFVLLAKGAQKAFFWSELVWTVVYLTLSWACISYFGLTGAGIAFAVSYIFSLTTNYIIARRLTGFRWSTENKHTILLFFSLIIVVFSGFYLLPPLFANALGTLGTLFSGVYSLYAVLKLGGRIWPSRPAVAHLGLGQRRRKKKLTSNVS